MPRITVNGRIIEVPEGRTILEALDDLGLLMNGVVIPHYCWHPKLPVDGSCRLCQVEVEGAPRLQIACNTPVTEGMAIRTDTESVRKAREGVMELLLVNHPTDCLSENGQISSGNGQVYCPLTDRFRPETDR